MNLNLDTFLATFFPDRHEPIHFRAFKPKNAPDNQHNRPAKQAHSRHELMLFGDMRLSGLNKTRGVYFAPNAGGPRDQDITRFNAVFVESDTSTITEQHRALDASPLLPSIRIETRRSVHAYWLLDGPCSADEWSETQIGLIAFFGGDPAIKNPSRVMRLPFFMHLTYNSENICEYDKKEVEITHFEQSRRYTVQQIREAFQMPIGVNSPREAAVVQEIIGNGHRNSELLSIAGTLRRRGLVEEEILAALRGVNNHRVRPKLEESELALIVKSVMRYSPHINGNEDRSGESLALPKLPDTALYGLAGDIVRTIEPHTEADNAALLVQLLSGVGCLIGKTAHFRAEADYHFTKLFCVLVGASSKGRKGTSFGYIKKILNQIDGTFQNCIQDGLSSGEGLIFHVREGVEDKRVFVVEPEFARVLRTMKRDGNTLSPVIRQAWDSDRLRVMTKTPLVATETHIAIVGHITLNELRRSLEETETANGFANRFLWVFCRRSKKLPFGGSLDDGDLIPLIQRLHNAVQHSRTIGELKRDDEANAYWAVIYGDLSEGHGGLLGSVTSRAEAQVMRLACLLALLDCCSTIQRRHLEAAMALWRYCEESAKYVFGNQTGDKIADKIFAALESEEGGMTRTQLRDLFSRNLAADKINSSLNVLIELGRIDVITRETEGRSAEIIVARSFTT